MKKLPAPLLAKISWRLLPFLLLMYIMAFLDRANVGFAKVAFQADTGISDAAFAFGAGVFFVGYALLEVPSNLIMHRIGARIWMCRIMVTWGLVSAAMMFAHNETTFYVLRFLLGVAEAGFFPGVILYLTYWFPAAHRAQAMGFFYFGAPLAFIFGSPLSGLLLELDGMGGWHGWQWLFAVEGLMAVAVGIWSYFYLTNRPADAQWLTADERRQVQDIIDSEERAKGGHQHSLLAAMCQPRVLYLALVYLLIQASVYGVVFYLPSQVAGLLGTKVGLQVGLVSAIPWLCALLAAWWVPGFAQRSQKPRSVASMTLLVAAIGMAASVSFSSPLLGVAALCFAAAGFIAVQPVFWTFPANTLAGAAAAGGIALINSLGAVGGFVAPIVKNWAEGHFHSPAAGLYLLAGTTVLAALLVLGIRARMAPAALQPRAAA
ncbi:MULTISPECIES: MFS transporter [unclassified Comamonas]|uniref:MFS transporter n=1 Tax=Comamonas squillarum TaxID=2977320 RepID=A0ABY6A6I0_9BURK|nr:MULTISPECIES: MFS transporter [unclassified Comamonas]PWB16278.1 MFS transporter [Comamonas sp. JNW]UXC20654.1 MFS transporter [Comamonas sp. PR12]